MFSYGPQYQISQKPVIEMFQIFPHVCTEEWVPFKRHFAGFNALGGVWHLISHAHKFTFKKFKANKRNTLLLNAIRHVPTCLENSGAGSAVIYAVCSNQPHKTVARKGAALRQQHLAFTKPLYLKKKK